MRALWPAGLRHLVRVRGLSDLRYKGQLLKQGRPILTEPALPRAWNLCWVSEALLLGSEGGSAPAEEGAYRLPSAFRLPPAVGPPTACGTCGEFPPAASRAYAATGTGVTSPRLEAPVGVT